MEMPAQLKSFFRDFIGCSDGRLFYIHSRWVDEGAFRAHAELEHTVWFLKRVDALVDQPREVGRMERID
jgi:quinol monooxygenase YgiN